ncbi:MAG: transposase [Candidatus Omnitrophica bacterium]|nr:transposase [Candidatus Omnitrophota bacterium]
MVKKENKTIKMITTNEEEILEKLVKEDNVFRKINGLVNFYDIVSPYYLLYSDIGAQGIDIVKGFKCLLVQFWEDYSDRQMEKALECNVAVKWFCGFELLEETPDHSYFGKLRKRLGANNVADIFNKVNDVLRDKGYFGDVFKFIDASSIITKTALWKERDEAIRAGEEKLNNMVVNKYAADKQAKWGAKSKNNIWFGYKRHHSVDMRYGLIDKLAVTPANILDWQALKYICPENQMIFMDKLYDCKTADLILKINHCAAGTIRKRNNRNKNRDLDRWRSGIRMPFEGCFSRLRKRAKFRGQTKVLMQCFFEAICHNLKKSIIANPVPIQNGA